MSTRLTRVLGRNKRLVRSESELPATRLETVGKTKQSASEGQLQVNEDTSSEDSSSDPESDTRPLQTREQILQEIDKAQRDLERVSAHGKGFTVGDRLRRRAAYKSAFHRLQNVQKVLELLDAHADMQQKCTRAESSYEKTRSQREKCLKTMVKWSEAHGETLARLHEREMDLLQLRNRCDDASTT